MSNTDDRIEKIAKILCQRDGIDPDAPFSDDDRTPNWKWHYDVTAAQIVAAIDEMK